MAHGVFHIIWILIIQLWLSLLITGNTEGDNLDCFPSIMVPRNTVWKSREMDTLKINCTVLSEPPCWNNINVRWCRIDKTNQCKLLHHSNNTPVDWRNITESKRLLFLIFQNISMHDSGLYRCEMISPTQSMSHAISVNVTEYFQECSTVSNDVRNQDNITNHLITAAVDLHLLPYVYIGSGAGALIFIVVVSVIVFRCRGKKKSMKKTIHENQSRASPVVDIAPPVYPREFQRKAQTLPAQVNPPQSYTYDTPPVRVRVTSLKDRPSAGRHPVSRGPPRRCRDHQEVKDVKEVEEENPLIYATLNHEAAPQRPDRVAHVQIEESEYAAVKIT